MKDDSKKSRAEEIIQRLRQQKAMEDITIRNIVDFKRAQREEEEIEEIKTQQMLEDMFSVDDEDQHEITAGLSIGRLAREPFHEFEMMEYAGNSLSLYKDIIETYKDETDPDKLKEIFEDTIFVMLKDMPDEVAQHISRNFNGIY